MATDDKAPAPPEPPAHLYQAVKLMTDFGVRPEVAAVIAALAFGSGK